MEITKNTPLSEILFNQDVADELSEIEGSLLRTINERMDAVQAQISAGGLGQGMIVNGEPLFYNEAAQICSDYLILSSNISMLVSDIKDAACEKELEELRKLRNLLLRDNDSWQALKEQYEREFRELISNDRGDLINEPGPNYERYKEEYYGENGKITRVNKHIEENNEKIAEIDRRIATVNAGGSSGSAGSSSGGSFSGGSSTIPDEAPTEAPGEPATESPSSNSGNSSSSGGSFSGGSSTIPNGDSSDDSSDNKKKKSGGNYQDGRFDDPDPNKYKL